MSPLEPKVPAAGEEIHLPGPSILPFMLAIGLTLALVGVTISLILTVVGLAIAIPALVKWVRSTRADIDELPAEH